MPSSASSESSTERSPRLSAQIPKAVGPMPPAAAIGPGITGPSAAATRASGDGSTKSRGRGRPPVPKLLHRHDSGSIIVPRSHATMSNDDENYGPNDARAMSPRRNSEETEAMEEATRFAVRAHARKVQLSLVEIAESIELVKADHDKLEKQNLALQDYIGGLTRSMSKSQIKSKR